jgi:hypothetical protein
VLVDVTVVDGVPVTVVGVVHVIGVRHRDVSAAFAVRMLMSRVLRMARGLALIDVSVVDAVQVTVVGVIHVIGVRHRDVSAAFAVGVLVIFVLEMWRGHDWRSPSSAVASSRAPLQRCAG